MNVRKDEDDDDQGMEEEFLLLLLCLECESIRANTPSFPWSGSLTETERGRGRERITCTLTFSWGTNILYMGLLSSLSLLFPLYLTLVRKRWRQEGRRMLSMKRVSVRERTVKRREKKRGKRPME
jgi:hypothetical protein